MSDEEYVVVPVNTGWIDIEFCNVELERFKRDVNARKVVFAVFIDDGSFIDHFSGSDIISDSKRHFEYATVFERYIFRKVSDLIYETLETTVMCNDNYV